MEHTNKENNNKENCIEWITGEHFVTASYTDKKFINRIKKIYRERSEEFKYFVENKDGSVCVKFPKRWIKNNPGIKADPDKPKKQVSEEQKAKMREALARHREKTRGKD